MSLTSPQLRRTARAALLLLVAALAATLLIAPNGSRADAAAVGIVPRVGVTAVHVTAAQKGIRYRWGGTTPHRGFDCSGLVRYVYRTKLHRRLPRTADAQWHSTIHITKKHVRRGDLVFFLSHGRAYHVGVYAGHGRMWHAPRAGKRVSLVRIWTSRWRPGRVR